jgi:hypothetical protein
MRPLNPSFVLFVLLALASSTLAETYKHPSGAFQFTPPPGWTKVKEDAQRVAFNSPDQEATLQVSIHTSLLDASGFDDQAYVKQVSNTVGSMLKMDVISTQKVMLDGQPAFRLNLKGDQSLMGPAVGFNILSATHKQKRFAFLGLQTQPGSPSVTEALNASVRSFRSF